MNVTKIIETIRTLVEVTEDTKKLQEKLDIVLAYPDDLANVKIVTTHP